MATAEVELKSPFIPLFQRKNFLSAILTLFDKEGKGRFSNGMTLELYSELLGQDTRVLRNKPIAPSLHHFITALLLTGCFARRKILRKIFDNLVGLFGKDLSPARDHIVDRALPFLVALARRHDLLQIVARAAQLNDQLLPVRLR